MNHLIFVYRRCEKLRDRLSRDFVVPFDVIIEKFVGTIIIPAPVIKHNQYYQIWRDAVMRTASRQILALYLPFNITIILVSVIIRIM